MQQNIILYAIQLYVIFHNHYENVESLLGQRLRPVTYGEYPFVVPLISTDSEIAEESYITCTANFLSNYFLLTTEHCIYNHQFNNFRVYMGSYNLHFNLELYPIWLISYDQWATVHNIQINFNSNDIGLIYVFNNLPYPIHVTTLSPISPQNRLYESTAKVLGWGNRNTVPLISSVLYVGNVTILSPARCHHRTEGLRGSYVSIPPTYFCTSASPHIIITSGDSGGPLLYEGQLIAISVGTCPKDDSNYVHSLSVNLHIGIDYYRMFISTITGIIV
ncbi:PREDICTED: chymotrypsin-2-like [Ceratosolen solmsi marchali]|uniref:Chymotrypsin-2-like n=1 Tax=Ceratosolen solmsi marchali TaxID=326594 RepID=A0AAJ6VKC0_9HYME|nr:PREDICTED: chymotrypsin-2-like [Ceratosolen solmsi marchali]